MSWQDTDRRQFLRYVTGAGTLAIAGCMGQDGNGDGDGLADGDGDGGADGDGDGDGAGDGDGDGGADFPSQDIRWIVGASAGGGFDTYSRGIAQFLPDHLPNAVDIVVENITPPRTGITETYRAEADGYNVGSWPALGFVAEQIVRDVPYDMREFTWLGRADRSQYVYIAKPDVESIEDLTAMDNPRLGTPGAGTTAWLSTLISNEVIGIGAGLVNFEGTSEALAAMLRDDVDAMLGPVSSPSITEPVENDEAHVLLSFTEDGVDLAPDAPTAVEKGYDQLTTFNLMRPVAAPPDLDQERTQVLRDSLMSTLESDEMQQWSKDQGRPINPASGDQVAEDINVAFDTLAEYEDILAENLD